MTENTYPFTPGERWNEGEATDEDKLNLARQHGDHLHEAANSFMSTDNYSQPFTLPAGSSLGAGSLLGMPSAVYSDTDENCQGAEFVDLTDPFDVWDVAAFRQQMQATSWHAALGDAPSHGVQYITEDQGDLVWWNRETGTAYTSIPFNTRESQTLNATWWLDGRTFLASSSKVYCVDWLMDRVYRWGTGGIEVYVDDVYHWIGTGGAGWLVLNSAAAYQIVNNAVNAGGACRDFEGELDAIGRPNYWAAFGTDGGCSVYNPLADAIYDSSITDAVDFVHVDADGRMAFTRDEATRDYTYYVATITGIAADAWTADGTWSNQGTDAEDLALGDSLVHGPVRLAGQSWALSDMPVLWLASDTGGAYAIHLHTSYQAQSGLIRITEDYASPYMKGDVKVCYPGHAVTDVSPAGIDLTNNSATPFSNGGPAGSYATGDGAADYLSLTGQSALNLGTDDFEIRFWFQTNDASNPGSEEVLVQLDDGGITDKVKVALNTSGQLVFDVTDDGDSTNDTITSGADFADGNWHHVSAGRDSGTLFLRVDEALVGSTAVSNAAGSLDPTELGWMATPAGGSFCACNTGGLVISGTAITAREVSGENSRGRRRIQSTTDANDTITDSDVAALAADPHGRHVAILGDDKALQIWSTDLMCPIASDTYGGTTARCAAIRMRGGCDDPDHLMGGSDQFELVQDAAKIAG